jgi:hypothetical protein
VVAGDLKTKSQYAATVTINRIDYPTKPRPRTTENPNQYTMVAGDLKTKNPTTRSRDRQSNRLPDETPSSNYRKSEPIHRGCRRSENQKSICRNRDHQSKQLHKKTSSMNRRKHETHIQALC